MCPKAEIKKSVINLRVESVKIGSGKELKNLNIQCKTVWNHYKSATENSAIAYDPGNRGSRPFFQQ